MTTEEELDEQIAKISEELSEGKQDGLGSPSPIKKDSILKFFREIINSPDSTKVANLDMAELGYVRTLLNVSNYAYSRNLKTVADYLETKAEITFASSMSKKGFLAQLFVTQIKKEKKDRPVQIKKGLFGNKVIEGETNE